MNNKNYDGFFSFLMYHDLRREEIYNGIINGHSEFLYDITDIYFYEFSFPQLEKYLVYF